MVVNMFEQSDSGFMIRDTCDVNSECGKQSTSHSFTGMIVTKGTKKKPRYPKTKIMLYLSPFMMTFDPRRFQAICLLLVPPSSLAHIFFIEPPARSCFYGGYWGPDGDGPWRREPCDRAAGSPTATWVAGTSTCVTVHEFVPHPASYDVSLAYNASLGPGDDDSSAWLPLVVGQDDAQPVDETGYQRFWIDLPAGQTCDACTIQVRQLAKDFDWYYYACADVKIVSSQEQPTDEAAANLSQDQCVWSPAPARLRAKILTTVVVASVILFDVLLVVGWAFAVRRVKQQQGEDSMTMYQAASMPKPKRFGLAILAWALVSGLAVGLVIGGLRSCWFG